MVQLLYNKPLPLELIAEVVKWCYDVGKAIKEKISSSYLPNKMLLRNLVNYKCQSNRKTIRAAAPEATEKISWQMSTFWQGENLVHFAVFKKHIGLYPGGEATSEFAERLAGYKTSKGAIQLPLGKPIDYELITDIVRWRVKREAKGSDTL